MKSGSKEKRIPILFLLVNVQHFHQIMRWCAGRTFQSSSGRNPCTKMEYIKIWKELLKISGGNLKKNITGRISMGTGHMDILGINDQDITCRQFKSFCLNNRSHPSGNNKKNFQIFMPVGQNSVGRFLYIRKMHRQPAVFTDHFIGISRHNSIPSCFFSMVCQF